MVNNEKKSVKRSFRVVRQFSETLKKEVVREIEDKRLGITQASREYGVSKSAIYKWLYRYSLHLKKGNKVMVEKRSQVRLLEEAKRRIAELERIIGQKQLELEIMQKVLEAGSELVGFDIKKKFGGQSSGDIRKIGKRGE